jgi:hypothetical protein
MVHRLLSLTFGGGRVVLLLAGWRGQKPCSCMTYDVICHLPLLVGRAIVAFGGNLLRAIFVERQIEQAGASKLQSCNI